MGFSDWIMTRLEQMRAKLPAGDAAPSGPPPAVACFADRLSCTFASHPANLAPVRKAIESFCERTELDRPAREELGLVVNEALANVIRHAYAGATDRPVEVTTERQGPGVTVTIRDWGSAVDPTTQPRPEPDPEQLVPGGLGLICIRRLVDAARYDPQPDGMRLVLTRTTPGSKATAECAEPAV